MNKGLIAKIALDVAKTVAAPYISDECLARFSFELLARIDAERRNEVVAEVKSYEGSLNDLTIIVWTGAPMPIGTKLYASPQPAIPEGWALVPMEVLDRFPEINLSNYGHDDVCTLNAWGFELVLAAAKEPK